jgi:hypothetical protein
MYGAETDKSGVISSAELDVGTPTYRIRAGNVMVYSTSLGKWVLTSNTTDADVATAADVAASETADADWQSKTISAYRNGALIVTVTLGGGDDTDAEIVTALNGNAIFAANCIASASGSRVHVKLLNAAPGDVLTVTSNLSTAFGANGTSDAGEEPEFRVLIDTGYVIDPVNKTTAVDDEQRMARRGHFIEANLLGLTQVARAALIRQGCLFS